MVDTGTKTKNERSSISFPINVFNADALLFGDDFPHHTMVMCIQGWFAGGGFATSRPVDVCRREPPYPSQCTYTLLPVCGRGIVAVMVIKMETIAVLE